MINFINKAHEKLSLAVTVVKEQNENSREINETSSELLNKCTESNNVEDHSSILGRMTNEILYHPVKDVDESAYGKIVEIVQSSQAKYASENYGEPVQVTNCEVGPSTQAVNGFDGHADIPKDFVPKIKSKKRVYFSSEEKSILDEFLDKCKYPTSKDYDDLAKRINRDKKRVKKYCKNKRHRKKKSEK